jgi:hypothetical protein
LHKLVEGFSIGQIKSGSMGYMVLEGCNMVTSKQTNKQTFILMNKSILNNPYNSIQKKEKHQDCQISSISHIPKFNMEIQFSFRMEKIHS